jgi:predicted house-cleaning noncanonical NTP pyrophosphatase (MazG superfamily)
MSKLVRDRIPSIIRQNGEPCVEGVHYHIASDDEYVARLRDKLTEEVKEYLSDFSVLELADIMEVVYALAESRHGTSAAELKLMQARRAVERGGFRYGVVLHGTPDPEPPMSLEHKLYVCPPGCDDASCNFCRGDLSSCTVCGGAEITLLPSCPGYKLAGHALAAIQEREIRTVADLKPEHREPS